MMASHIVLRDPRIAVAKAESAAELAITHQGGPGE